MQIRIFNIPITDNGEMQAEMRCIELVEMNRFLSVSRVLDIEQHFFQNEKSAFWSSKGKYAEMMKTG